MTDVHQIHEVRSILHEDVFYPPHAPRTESEAYKAVHHKLVVEEDTPCYICGLRHSELGDPTKNIHGATAIETHHVWVEWSLTNAVDAEKLGEFFGVDAEDVPDWVDHNTVNLMVLCDRHHRHKEVGIHELSYPIFIAQKFLKADYTLTAAEPPKAGDQQ